MFFSISFFPYLNNSKYACYKQYGGGHRRTSQVINNASSSQEDIISISSQSSSQEQLEQQWQSLSINALHSRVATLVSQNTTCSWIPLTKLTYKWCNHSLLSMTSQITIQEIIAICPQHPLEPLFRGS